MSSAGGRRSEGYLRLLLWLLVPAAFFNGYAGELRAVVLPKLQDTFHVSTADIGLANVSCSSRSSATPHSPGSRRSAPTCGPSRC